MAIDREEARHILQACGIPIGANFFSVRQSTVELLNKEAKSRCYREPKNANGSRARYFHDMLQRKAAQPSNR